VEDRSIRTDAQPQIPKSAPEQSKKGEQTTAKKGIGGKAAIRSKIEGLKLGTDLRSRRMVAMEYARNMQNRYKAKKRAEFRLREIHGVETPSRLKTINPWKQNG
jgi:hypothetical protein